MLGHFKPELFGQDMRQGEVFTVPEDLRIIGRRERDVAVDVVLRDPDQIAGKGFEADAEEEGGRWVVSSIALATGRVLRRPDT